MELDDSSRLSTPPEMEPVMDCSLVLTTLSGVTIKVSLSVAKFDRFEDLEDQVMDYLVSVRIYSTEERRLHTTCLETAKKAMESFGLFE